MGADILFANPEKQEFLTENSYNCCAKSGSYLYGLTATAVAYLVCRPSGIEQQLSPLAGSWYGHRVIVAGDNEVPNMHGFETSTREFPTRNFYELVCDEYRDISIDAMLALCCLNIKFAEESSRIAKRSAALFIVLAKFAIKENCQNLMHALTTIYGQSWQAKYHNLTGNNSVTNTAADSLC